MKINEKNKVSIIVAIYKSENFLDKLLTSAINQTYKNIEIILVNDGSPDNSGSICDNFALLDSRIKVIHKENGGACDARNTGMAEATGDFIVIVDGDDWLSLDFIEYMMKLVTETNSDMAFSDKIFTTRDQVQIDSDKIEIWSAEDATAAIIYPHMAVGPWNKIYKTDLLKKNNITFSVPWSGEGMYFAATAAQYANHVGVGHRKVYNYRLNNMNSGLTHYNIDIGRNALWNTINIGRNLHIKSKKIEHAIAWRTWANYFFVLKLIIATNTKEENKSEYENCLLNLRKMMLKVFIYSKVSFRQRIRILITSLVPVYYAKRSIRISQKALAKDVMK